VQVAGKHGDERGGADDAPRQEGCKNQGARGMADSLQSYLMMLTIINAYVDLHADPDAEAGINSDAVAGIDAYADVGAR